MLPGWLAALAACAPEVETGPSAPTYAYAAPGYGSYPATAVTPLQAPSRARGSVVAWAASQVGHPYCWGGTGPRCFDCSGLAQRAWQQVGVQLPRSADDVARRLPSVPLDQVQPGDLLWWPGHVAIYAGNGWTVEALNAASGVVLRRAPRPRRAFRPI